MAILLNAFGQTIDAQQQLDEMDRYDCEESLYEFLRHAWKYIDPSPWVDGWPMEAVAEHLQAVVDGDIKRLAINIPPRCAKSTLVSVAFPAWTWAQSIDGPTSGPRTQFFAASYAMQLSLRDSVKCRRLIESPWYQRLWGDRFKLNTDQNTKSRFGNDKGGERLITSIGGTGTGEGGHIGIVDDANSASEAFSEASITAVIDWWDQTFSNRLNDPKTGAFIGVQQRLAENDWTGHILSKDTGEWTHLCYDDQTEILTRRGWVPFVDLQAGEHVMGVDPATLQGRWEVPTKIIREPYKGQMIHYKTMTADLMVTPDHRMVYGDENNMSGGEPSHWRTRSASDLPGNFYLPQVIQWNGEGEPVFFGNRVWEPMAFAEFMGWYLAEGCASAKSRTTRIVQKATSPDVPDIERVLGAVPFHVGRHKNSDTMLCWQIKDRFLARDLAPLGDSLTKRAPAVLKEMAPKYLRAFLIAYARGDGHFAVRNNLKTTIGTASKQMADDLQECAVKAGWASSATYHIDRSGGFFPNGYARKDTTIHSVYLRASKVAGRDRKIGSRIRPSGTRRVDYDGMVYCVSVPSTAVAVRRNGRVAISGNCLPMRYEPERSFYTSIGWKDPRTEPGELLWEERFGEAEVASLERAMGPFIAAGQLQQSPEPPGGGIIKREWWVNWDEKAYPPMDYIIGSLDTAYTEKTINDASALTIWGVFSHDPKAVATRTVGTDGRAVTVTRSYSEGSPKVMLMDGWNERLEFHDLVTRVAKTCIARKVDMLLIEDKAAGHSVAQELRRLYSNAGFGVRLENPRSLDKVSRLYSVQHLFAPPESMIYAPDRKWADDVITQVSQFPKGKHDDMVDTVSQALRHLRDLGMLTRGQERLEEIEAEKQYQGSPPGALYPA